MSKAGNGSIIASNCSQVKNSFCRRRADGPSSLASRNGREAARRVRGRREKQSQSSLPGLTRQSILFAKSFYEEDGPAGQARG